MQNDQIVLHQTSAVKRNRGASFLCKELFPDICQHPARAELQRLVIEGWKLGASRKAVQSAGFWWLWARELMIENTVSKNERHRMINIAVQAGMGGKIHFVSARSPELLHSQIQNQADSELPRSRKAIAKLAQLATTSSTFLPTLVTIFLADLAVDNWEAITASCNPEAILDENTTKIIALCDSFKPVKFQVLRMSQMTHPLGKLGELLEPDGTPRIEVQLSPKSQRLVDIATRESQDSHQRMFGWTEDQSKAHNTNLGITMGLVGQAVRQLNPPAILIHNESFISRGALNNLFTDPANPLPIICLKDLLEKNNGSVDCRTVPETFPPS